jgi:hypothetical protein
MISIGPKRAPIHDIDDARAFVRLPGKSLAQFNASFICKDFIIRYAIY